MKIKQVPIRVAIVIPLIGLLDEPINPTMRDDTVTKKAPKMIISKPNNNLLPTELPGIKLPGSSAIIRISTRLPTPTSLMDRSRSVRGISSFATLFPFKEPILPLNEEMIVGIVLINVMNPPAATAPAPICRT